MNSFLFSIWLKGNIESFGEANRFIKCLPCFLKDRILTERFSSRNRHPKYTRAYYNNKYRRFQPTGLLHQQLLLLKHNTKLLRANSQTLHTNIEMNMRIKKKARAERNLNLCGLSFHREQFYLAIDNSKIS